MDLVRLVVDGMFPKVLSSAFIDAAKYTYARLNPEHSRGLQDAVVAAVREAAEAEWRSLEQLAENGERAVLEKRSVLLRLTQERSGLSSDQEWGAHGREVAQQQFEGLDDELAEVAQTATAELQAYLTVDFPAVVGPVLRRILTRPQYAPARTEFLYALVAGLPSQLEGEAQKIRDQIAQLPEQIGRHLDARNNASQSGGTDSPAVPSPQQDTTATPVAANPAPAAREEIPGPTQEPDTNSQATGGHSAQGPEGTLPGGVVTFIFTDIVSSTEIRARWPASTSERREEEYRLCIQEPHDALVCTCVRASGGHVVKATGDGFMLAFADAESAVDCALEIQQRLSIAAIPTPLGHYLQVRIGLNTGQADPRDGDYGSEAVHKAVRVQTCAEPGQVLLSRETYHLVMGGLRNVKFRSIGTRAMKGLTKDELFLAWRPDTSAEPGPPPPPGSPDGKYDLQVTTDHVVGRGEQIDKVVGYLGAFNSVVVTGLAGVGKTTVLYTAVRRLAKTDPYHVVCPIQISEDASVGTAEARLEQCLKQILTRLIPILGENLAYDSTDALFRQADRLIGPQRVLLVLDNCNSQASQGAVSRIRASLPCIVVAASGQIRTNWGIAQVEMPDLSEKAAEELFLETIREKGCSHLADVHPDALSAALRRIPHHPMAIRQVARQFAQGEIKLEDVVFSPDDYAWDALFDSARKLLPPECENALRLIGIVATAKLRVDMVRHVANVPHAALRMMANQYLIDLDRNQLEFTVHELVRGWCRRPWVNPPRSGRALTASGRSNCLSVSALQRGLVTYYVKLLKAKQPSGPLTQEMALIDGEWENIRLLIREISDPLLVTKLVHAAIGDHYEDPNGYAPRRRRIPDLIEQTGKILNSAQTADGALGAAIRKNMGHFFYWRGYYLRAAGLFDLSLEDYKRLGNLEGQACVSWLKGYVADDGCRYKEALALYEEGARLAKEGAPDDLRLEATGEHLIGCALYHWGRFVDAMPRFHRSLELCSRLDPGLKARTMRRLGSIAMHLSDLDKAEEWLNGARILSQDPPRHRDLARIDRQLALVKVRRFERTGDRQFLEDAERLLQSVLAEFVCLKAARGTGYTQLDLAAVRRHQGRLGEARALCNKSREEAEREDAEPTDSRPELSAQASGVDWGYQEGVAEGCASLYGQAAAWEELAKIEAAGSNEAESLRCYSKACNIYTVIDHKRGKKIMAKVGSQVDRRADFGPRVRGVLFDLMDTLASMEKGAYEDAKHKFAEKMEVSFDRFTMAWDQSRPLASRGDIPGTVQRMRWVAAKLGRSMSDSVLSDLAEEEQALWRETVHMAPDAIPLLDALRGFGIASAIVSNGPFAMACLPEKLHLTERGIPFILSCEVGAAKPDPEPYQRALERLGLNASECLFVGDGNDHELDGARKVSLRTVKIVLQEPAPYARLANQSLDWDFEVNSLAELTSALREQRGGGSR